MQQLKFIFIFLLLSSVVATFAQKKDAVIDSFSLQNSPTDSTHYTIGKINIKGNKKTKNYIVFREVVFKEGDILSAKELLQKLQLSKNQLMNTALFNEALVYVSALENNVAAINIDLKERWYLWPLPYFKLVDRNFNQWWFDNKRDLNRTNYGIKFSHDNLSGRRDKLQTELVTGYNQQIFINYAQPFSDKNLKHGFAVGAFYNRQHEVNYTTINNKQVFVKLIDFAKESKGLILQYGYRPDSKNRLIVNLGFTNENIHDSVVKLNPNYYGQQKKNLDYFSVYVSYKYNNVDYIPFPQKGIMYEIGLYNRGFTKEMNLLSFAARSTYALPFSKNNFMQFHNLSVLRFTNQQPFINQNLMGYGDMYLRGNESYVIDGTMGFISNNTLYQKLLKYVFKPPIKIKNHEKIPFTFYLKAFVDAGYVYNNMSTANSYANTFLYTAGMGLDIVSLYDFVFRMEYSFNQFGKSGFGIRARSDF